MSFMEWMEARSTSYKKTWNKLSKGYRFLIVGILFVGIIQVFVGVSIICSSKGL